MAASAAEIANITAGMLNMGSRARVTDVPSTAPEQRNAQWLNKLRCTKKEPQSGLWNKFAAEMEATFADAASADIPNSQ